MLQTAHCTLQVLFTYCAYFTVSARVCFIPRENKLRLSRNRRTVIANGDLETVAFLVVGDQCIVVIDSLRLAELFLLAWDFFGGRVFLYFFNPSSVLKLFL